MVIFPSRTNVSSPVPAHSRGSLFWKVTCASALAVTACLAPLPSAHAASSVTCDTAYYSAHALSALSAPDSGLPHASAAYTSALASEDWLSVALLCPGRYSEGIVRSALSAVNSSSPAPAPSAREIASTLTSTTDAEPFLLSPTLRALSLAEDRYRFATSVLATRDYSGPDYVSLLTDAELLSQTYARLVTDSSTDSRQRIYDTTSLTNYSGQNTATGITMPVYASIELDAALEELTAVDKDSSSQSSQTDPASDQRSRSVALSIRSHLLRAFSAGAPRVAELYLS